MLAHRQWVVLLAVAAFVLARLTGAHLHLCLDGSEPPVAMHTNDGAHLDHHAGDTLTHDDVDVEPLGDILSKTVKVDLGPIVAIVVLLFLLVAAPTRLSRIPELQRPPHPPPRFIRPPLRAPPV